MTDFFALCHNLNQLVRKILGMRGHEPNPFQSIDLFYHRQKLRKGHRVFQSFSIGIHVLTKKHDFHHTVSHQLFDFVDDSLRLPASFSSANIGNDAIAAEVVAAEHDIYTGFKRIISF